MSQLMCVCVCGGGQNGREKTAKEPGNKINTGSNLAALQLLFLNVCFCIKIEPLSHISNLGLMKYQA